MRFIPRDEKFYDLFRAQVENLYDAAQKLVALFENIQDAEKAVREIRMVEHKGDQIIHQLISKLNQTFITPFDREDIHALASALDDVVDLIDAVADRIPTYKIKQITPGALQLARLILHCAEILVRAVSQLSKPQNILDYCRQLSQLEKEADRIRGDCIARLFENSLDPIEVIKWKEVYEVLEATTDKCEDVSNVMEAVVLKAA